MNIGKPLFNITITQKNWTKKHTKHLKIQTKTEKSLLEMKRILTAGAKHSQFA